MLVLSRKVGETICIGDGIHVTVIAICGNKLKLGVAAPLDIAVHREEMTGNHRDFNLDRVDVFAVRKKVV